MVLVNLLTLGIAIASFLVGEQWIQEYPRVVSGMLTTIGVANIILRFYTNESMKPLLKS